MTTTALDEPKMPERKSADDAAESEPAMSALEIEAFWAPWREVWEIIGDRWPEGVSAIDAVREQRRG